MIKLKAIAECSIQLEKGRIDPGSGVLFGLLAHLIVERGRAIPRTTLTEFFWSSRDRRDASHCLRQAVYKLRQLGAPVETTGEHYTLPERSALADFDCADERALALSSLAPEEAVAVFPNYTPNASPAFLAWLERAREKAGRSIRAVLVRALGEARRRNGWDEAAKLARQCLVLDPLNEEATLTLAEFTALRGDKRDALRIIDGYIEEMGASYADLRLPASLLRNRISERVSYPPASAAGKVPLVGREDSLRVLANVASEVTGGAGHTCVIHGPPGIGKTRLLTEFANISAMRGARIIRVDCHADAVERPLALFMELAPQLLRLPGALGCAPEALKLVKRLGSYDPNERLDPDEYGGAAFLHAAVRSSLRDLVDAIAAERPLYLMIEDVHWIDRVSLEVLKELIGSNRHRQLLVVMTTRTLGDGGLLRGIDGRQLVVHDLPRLAMRDSHSLARSVCNALGINADDEIAEWCTERSDGNPLFVTELLAHWREHQDRTRIPTSLGALVDERVRALDKPALYAMQAIVLLEGEATYEVLEAVLGMQRWQVMACAEQLEKSGLVLATAERLVARHSLLGDAALEQMGESASLILHRAIAAHFGADTGGGLTDPHRAWRAARHWSLAGARSTALELVTTTARHMATVGAVYEASLLLHKAFALCQSDHEKLSVLNERRVYLRACGQSEELRENCERAMDLESRLTGSGEHVHSENEIVFLHACLDRRRIDGVFEHALRCTLDVSASNAHRLAAASAAVVVAYGDSDAEAAERVVTAVSEIRPVGDLERIHMLRTRLVYEFEFGEVGRAVEIGDEYLAVFRGLPSGATPTALRVSAFPHRTAGNFDIVERRLHEALDLARRQSLPSEETQALLWLALDAADRAEYSTALEVVGDLLRVVDRCPIAAGPPMRHSIATIALMAGDDTLAVEELARVKDLSLTAHGRCDDLAVRIFYAAIHGKRFDDTELEELRLLSDRLETRPGQEGAIISIALALHHRGQPEEARRVVARYRLVTRRERWPSRNPILVSFGTQCPITTASELRAAVGPSRAMCESQPTGR